MSIAESGSVLDGKYEIVRSLGAGGMGEVFLARHLHLDELRVIKVLRADLAADPASQKRFLREARLATQIKHPNVAILYDCSRLAEGSFYMVWEHVEGEEVGDRIDREGPFPLHTAIDLGIQALRGLGAIHATGVIHRDISPDNLMIHVDAADRLRLKIIDLGLARTLAPDPAFEVTQVGTFTGKLRYCSPEQAQVSEGPGLDHRTDLYSLGLVLYEMITCRFPFEGSGPASLVQRMSQEALPLAGRNPDVEVPAALDRVVARALARDPEQRFADAVAFIEALDDVRRGLAGAGTQKVAAAPARPARPPAPGEGPRRAPTSELSPTERAALLQQIDRAARRVRETTQVIRDAGQALDTGDLDRARDLVATVEQSNPAAPGLSGLRDRLRDAERLAGHRQRVEELEALLNKYLKARQRQLAVMALDSLLDLFPNHPRRDDYESWVGLLDQEVEKDHRVAEALAVGREALTAGDFRRGRRQLAALRKLDEEAAAAFDGELRRAERQLERDEELDKRHQRFEEAVAGGQVEAAERQLAWLRERMSRVAFDTLAARLPEARLRAVEIPFEERFEKHLGAAEWGAAREVASELGAAAPQSARPAAMRAEVDRREGEQRRRTAVAQGERQIERLIATGDVAQSRLALKILLQMDPENRRRRSFERQIQALER